MKHFASTLCSSNSFLAYLLPLQQICLMRPVSSFFFLHLFIFPDAPEFIQHFRGIKVLSFLKPLIVPRTAYPFPPFDLIPHNAVWKECCIDSADNYQI